MTTAKKPTRHAATKTGAKTASAPKHSAPAPAPTSAPVAAPQPVGSALDTAVAATLDPKILPPSMQPELKKRELIDKVVRVSGVKKRDVKPAIEAALEILGAALAEGRELNVKPFGKMKVQRVRDTGNGLVLVTKVRQPNETEKAAPDPLAQAAE
ncbi:HU family DNA-binding protein [Roseivivax sp. CAU 1753]